MTAHQSNAVLPEAFREVARLRHVGDEQVGVAEIIGDVSDRHLDADKASRMDHRPQLCPLGNAEGQGKQNHRLNRGGPPGDPLLACWRENGFYSRSPVSGDTPQDR